jgi:hypothetical protein
MKGDCIDNCLDVDSDRSQYRLVCLECTSIRKQLDVLVVNKSLPMIQLSPSDYSRKNSASSKLVLIGIDANLVYPTKKGGE